MFAAIIVGLGNTLSVTFGGFIIGAILGFPVAQLLVSKKKALRTIGRTYVDIVRGVPVLVWLFVIFFGFGGFGILLAPMIAAIVAFGAVATAYIAEIYRAGLYAIPKGQWEASHALGFDTSTMHRTVIIPQLIRAIAPTLTTFWISLLKDSSLASVIGVLELTFRASSETQKSGNALEAFGIAGLIYLVISVAVGLASRRADLALRAKYKV